MAASTFTTGTNPCFNTNSWNFPTTMNPMMNWPMNTFGGNFPHNFEGNFPYNFGSNFPYTFGGNFPYTFGGNFPYNFGSNFPSTFGSNFPSTFGSNFPSTFGGNFPSTFGGNFPYNFGSNFPYNFGSNFPSTMAPWNASKDFSGWNKWESCIRDASFRPTSMAEFFTFMNPIHISPIDGSRMLYLCFDVKGFKPEEIKIDFCVKDHCITVEAKEEVKDKEHTVVRTYLRKFVIPTELCADFSKCDFKCHYTFDGKLVIEGHMPKLTADELKTLKEKCPSKLTSMSNYGAVCPAGFGTFESNFGCSIPIKTN